ncbi:PilZ domain-containing protein [Marinobacter sp. X15-166B]|uniref:PilZ domain-containing protein n=1 Tax=Marinobacter sp. X15-166B TaxID=1897620 RepID=UPI00085BFD91|nr:PilZ domain-containing protein [Marinobacter sp. X15-166B]OEY66630.1 pilus assembly protein [Marinobacter sp. X15-166B]
MTDRSPDLRRFQRIPFDAACTLHCEHEVWPTEVVDISFNGVLLARPAGWDKPLGQPCEVVVCLNDQDAGIVMAVSLKHIEAHRLGFQCQLLDLASAAHLKRLVELNLGDPALLERELGQLLGS